MSIVLAGFDEECVILARGHVYLCETDSDGVWNVETKSCKFIHLLFTVFLVIYIMLLIQLFISAHSSNYG